MQISTIIYDFGGVIADEGWAQGLTQMALDQGVPPKDFFKTVDDRLHDLGYVTGKATEAEFWDVFKDATGITKDTGILREMILSRFTLRPTVIADIRRLKEKNYNLVILSDQVNWLDELNERAPFFPLFNTVYNSYHIGKSKRDATLFDDVLTWQSIRPEQALFIDDNPGNIERAQSRGISTIHFTGIEAYKAQIAPFTA